jgi:hypothetical protein
MKWKVYRHAASGSSRTERGMEFAAKIYVILNASRYVMVSKAIERTFPRN